MNTALLHSASPVTGETSSDDRRRYGPDALMLLLLGAATLLFFWPIWLLDYRFPIGGGDLWGQLYPVWSYVSEWLRRGVFPLWSTRIMGGDPIISEAQYGLVNPLNWLLFASSPIPHWLVSLRSAVSLWLAGLGLFLYLRRSPVWRLQNLPACVAALAYMFSDPFIAHLGHPQFNDTMAWLPWVLWATDAALRRRRGLPVAALALSAMWGSGHAQAALYATILVGVYALWQALEAGRGRALRRIGRMALAVGLGAWLAAPGLLPALERYPYTDRAAVPPSQGEYEFHLGMGWDFLSPMFHGRNMKTFWAPWDRVESGTVGVVALSLALLGLTEVRRRRTLFLWTAGIAAILFSLGTQGPIYPLLAGLPLFDATWKTGRAIFILSLVLAIAAGLGVQRLQLRRRGIVWGTLALVGAVVIACQAKTWSGLAPDGGASARALVGLYLAATVLGCAGLLAGLGRNCLVGRAGMVALVLAELVATGAMADVEPTPSMADDPHAAVASYLRSDDGWFRVDVDGKARGLWSPASVMAAGFDVPQGTGNPMEVVAHSQFYWGIPHKGVPAYNLLGAKYIIVPKGALPGADGIWPVFSDDPLVDVHLNTNAMTRVWLLRDVVPVGSLEEAYARVLAPDFVPAGTATVLGGTQLDAEATDASERPGTIEVLGYGPNRATFAVTTGAPALLVLSDLNYPGWQGWINGRSAPIYATNGIFRGMYVPAGASRVEMRYVPQSFQMGIGLLLAGWLTIGVVVWRQRAVSAGGPSRSASRKLAALSVQVS